MNIALFISVKPKYMQSILQGHKSIELRKSLPRRVSANDWVVLYCTSPVMAVVGIGKIKKIHVGSPKRMWDLNSRKLGVSLEEYAAYYKDHDNAVGIELKEVSELNNAVSLSHIRRKYPLFHPPQSYRYVVWRKAIIDFYR